MPTWTWGISWSWVLWNLAGFLATAIWCSFAEWILHSRVMHRKTIVSFPYELHAVGHHGMFRDDETYHAQNEDMKKHVTFVPRDYSILLLANAPLWAAAEWLSGRPLMVGCFLATLGYLGAFDLFHWGWHVPSDTWFQRTRLFQWMKARHRLHHGDQTKNFNLIVPIADLVLGTFAGPKR